MLNCYWYSVAMEPEKLIRKEKTDISRVIYFTYPVTLLVEFLTDT